MSKEVAYNEYVTRVINQLVKGAFLTTAYGGKTNVMTIGWGNIGFAWGKPVFTIMVRASRHTYELIEKSGEFTVSIPFSDMQKALGICGTKSGRDTDKFAAANLTAAPGQKLSTPVIAGNGIHYECKVLYKQAMDPAALVPDQNKQWYGNGDYHTFYFGEIVACYLQDDK